MPTRFPPAATIEAFRALSRGDPRVVAAAGALCRELGLGDATPFEAGSLPVFAAGGDRVLKLFPPCFARECGHERAVLDRLGGALPVATPRPIAEGDADGWRWLLMERLPGTPLDAVWPSLPAAERGVLLHTEIMRAHVLAVRDGAGWSPSGVVDFEPAMIGDAEYEFASVGVFLTCGEGPVLRALLLAYGYRDADLGVPLRRRFLAHALLHRYSNLRWYLERLPPGDGISTLDALAERWWAVGDEPELAPPR